MTSFSHSYSPSGKTSHLCSWWLTPLSLLVTLWVTMMENPVLTPSSRHDLTRSLRTFPLAPLGPCSGRGALLSLAPRTPGRHLSKHGIPRPTAPVAHDLPLPASAAWGLTHIRETAQALPGFWKAFTMENSMLPNKQPFHLLGGGLPFILFCSRSTALGDGGRGCSSVLLCPLEACHSPEPESHHQWAIWRHIFNTVNLSSHLTAKIFRNTDSFPFR